MPREVPRRLPPTPEERLRTVVSTVAPGSDQGSTLFARRVPDSGMAAARSIVPPGGLAIHNLEASVTANFGGFSLAAGATERLDSAARSTFVQVGTGVHWDATAGNIIPDIAAMYYVTWYINGNGIITTANTLYCTEGVSHTGIGYGLYYHMYYRFEPVGGFLGAFQVKNLSAAAMTLSGFVRVSPFLY